MMHAKFLSSGEGNCTSVPRVPFAYAVLKSRQGKGLGAAVLLCSVYLGEKQKPKALSLQANIDAGHWKKII